MIGLGNRLDLAWQPLLDSPAAETALEVTTSVVATLVDGESVTLEATQRIQSLGQQGTFDELRVALPAGYELLKLDGPEHRDKTDPANPNQVVIQLKKATTGPIELRWAVRSKLPSVGESFALEGFEVDRARLQTGYLAVVVVGDFRIVPQEDKFLQRIDATDLPGALRQTPASAAYRFLNRLLLRMKLQRIEPYVTVDPTLLLNFSSDSAELEGAFRLQVLRGSIGSFRLRWPKWKQQGWTIGEAELPGHVELRTTGETGDLDIVRFEFAEPVKGTIDLRFRARCPLANVEQRIPMTLPFVDSYHRFPTLLAVLSADNVEADLRPAESTLLRPMSQPSSRIAVPNEWRSLRRADYRIESTQSELEVALSVHPRKIQGTTHIDASIRNSAVTVRQSIVYDVAYERISQLRFAIPEGLPPEQLRFFSQSGDEIPALSVPASGAAPAEIRVTLESPAIGRFEVDVRYALPGLRQDPGSRETALSIPVIHSNDVVLSETRLTCRDAAGRDTAVDGDNWQRHLSPVGLPIWIVPQVPAAVALKIAHAAGTPNGTQISKTLIRTIVASEGTVFSRAQYTLAEGISELSVAFPRDLEPIAFWWNRRKQRAVPVGQAVDGVTLYEIDVADRAANGDRLFTIDFMTKNLDLGRFGAACTLSAPQLPEDLRASQVYWQVELPYHEHLFTEPDGFSPEYRWTAGRFFWSRESQMSVADLEQWIGSQAGPPPLPVSAGENRYLFGTFGNPPRLAFRAMRQWSITLIGAGTALLLGLALLWRPALLHAVTFWRCISGIANRDLVSGAGASAAAAGALGNCACTHCSRDRSFLKAKFPCRDGDTGVLQRIYDTSLFAFAQPRSRSRFERIHVVAFTCRDPAVCRANDGANDRAIVRIGEPAMRTLGRRGKCRLNSILFAVCLVIWPMFGFPGPGVGRLAADDSFPEIRRVFVPADLPDQWPNGDWQPIPLQELERQLEQAAAVRRRPAPFIERADFSATYINGELKDTRADWHTVRPDPLLNLLAVGQMNLNFSRLDWSDPDLNALPSKATSVPALWGTTPEGTTGIVVDQRHGRLVGEWSRIGRRLSASTEFDLELPPAAMSSMTLTIPDGLILSSTTGEVSWIRSTSRPGWNDWRVALGSRTSTRLRIAGQADATTARPLIVVRSNLNYVVRSEAVRLLAEFSVESLETVLRDVQLAIDPEIQVTSVEYGDGGAVAWQSTQTRDGRLVVVQLPESSAGEGQTIRVQGISQIKQFAAWPIPRMRVQNSVDDVGKVTLRIQPPLQVADIRTDGYLQTELTTSAADGESLVFKQLRRDGTITIVPADAKPELACHAVTLLTSESNQWTLNSQMEWKATAGSAFAAKCLIPDMWEIVDVRPAPGENSASLAGWDVEELGLGKRMLQIYF